MLLKLQRNTKNVNGEFTSSTNNDVYAELILGFRPANERRR